MLHKKALELEKLSVVWGLGQERSDKLFPEATTYEIF